LGWQLLTWGPIRVEKKRFLKPNLVSFEGFCIKKARLVIIIIIIIIIIIKSIYTRRLKAESH